MINLNNYKYIIFDFDGTLSDFQQSKENAKGLISPFLKEMGINTDDYWKHYEEIFEPLFSRYINHELSVREYRLFRFIHHGVTEGQAEILNGIYLNEVHKPILFNDVIPFLSKIKNRGTGIVILTNGPESQRPKIESCPVNNYTERIFISSEIGWGKPDIKAYSYVINELNVLPTEILMIGDNYENDCAAAERAGITAVQIIRNNEKPMHKNYIYSLNDLL